MPANDHGGVFEPARPHIGIEAFVVCFWFIFKDFQGSIYFNHALSYLIMFQWRLTVLLPTIEIYGFQYRN